MTDASASFCRTNTSVSTWADDVEAEEAEMEKGSRTLARLARMDLGCSLRMRGAAQAPPAPTRPSLFRDTQRESQPRLPPPR